MKPKRPGRHEKPAKEAPSICPSCRQPVECRTFQGSAVLKCIRCRKAGTAPSPPEDWVSFDDEHWKTKLARAIERDRRWTKLVLDPHQWTDLSGNALDDYDD
jgi:hypothetical protein